ncbi:MAG: hypothetical protein IJT62_08360 [Oscillospiraceae bacterium]|nr:hypothetical protein [Oscillospiraceae bacterium]
MGEKDLLNERRRLFNNAFSMEHNERVPLFSNFWTWKMLDSEYPLRQSLSDYDLLEKLVSDFQERYQFDSHFDLGTRNPIRVVNALGTEGFHQIDDENNCLAVSDHQIMEASEYRDYVNNPTAFFYTKAFARYCPDLTTKQLNAAVKEYRKFTAFSQRITKKFAEDYQCVPVSPYYLKEPFEYFFTALRGIKGMSMDIRRNSGDLLEALDAIYETIMLPGIERVLKIDTSPYLGDAYTSFMGWSILNEKQFDKFYWPYFIRVFSKMLENDKKLFLMSEATLLRFADHFDDIPKGRLMVQLEQDDIFAVRKRLPNMSIAGGMSPELLGRGTPDECVAYTKKLIDELGNGFVLSQTKMMSYASDCKRENLLAVNNFALNYRT